MTSSGPSPQDIFDVKKVRRLVELMKEHDLSELDLKQGEQRIKLRRGHDSVVTYAAPPSQYAPPAHVGGTSGATSAAPSAPPADDPSAVVIKSPMVGTFYIKANPESPPFVKVGDHIGTETVVCVIEAMKVFNQIPAEVSGQITAVLVENGQPVEFGQPLFKVSGGK